MQLQPAIPPFNPKSGPLKVLHVIDQLEPGGAERVFIDLVSLLHQAGVHVEVLLICKDGALVDQIPQKVTVHRLNRTHKFALTTMGRFLKIAKGFDLVHVHMRHNWKYVMACCASRLCRLPLIFHDHYGAIAVDRKRPTWMRWMPGWVHYIGVSKELTEWAETILLRKPETVHLLANTIIPPEKTLDRSGKSLLMIAHFRPAKNIEAAISLAEQVGLPLILIGKANDSEYAMQIKKRIEASPTTTWLPNETRPNNHFADCAAAIHPAHSESGPLVLMEYLAHGLPFLASQTGEVAAQAAPHLPQLFLPRWDMAEWQERLTQILANPPQPERLRSVFETLFGPEAYIAKCLSIYGRILGKDAIGAP